MKNILFLFLIYSLFMSGCVRTFIRSSANPDFQGKQYGNVLVTSFLSDIESQQIVEDAVVEKLQEKNINATPSYKVFYKGAVLTKEQKREKIKSKGFDAALSVLFTDSYTTQTYVPPTTTTTGNITETYNGYNYSEQSSQSGGYYLSKPNFDIRSNLQETENFVSVWMSDSDSHGCAICGFDRVMGSFADTLVNQLLDDGILKPHTPIQKYDDLPDKLPPNK